MRGPWKAASAWDSALDQPAARRKRDKMPDE